VTEARLACADGAAELDMVVNIGQVLAEEWPYVEEDIKGVVEEARRQGATTKVIFETGLLPRDELKVRLCEISERAGAAYVKTSTGFGFVRGPDGNMQSTGATEADIILMRKHCSDSVGVKASGGIRSYADAARLVELGATRLGTSATQAIVEGEQGAETTAKTDY
jgi:deoxyribose-phosphate aldolase